MSISWRLFLFAVVIALLGITGQWADGDMAGLWRLPSALLLILVVIERLLLPLGAVVVEREVMHTGGGARPLELGVKARYRVRFGNPLRFTLRLESQPDFPAALQGDAGLDRWRIPSGESFSRDYAVLPTRLGAHRLGDLHFRILGRFGLVWWKRRFDDGESVRIAPAGFAPGEAVMGAGNRGWKPARHRAGSGTELLALRDYQMGDPLHAIDWKATARSDNVMVRVYSREQRLEMALLLDCGRNGRLLCGEMDRLHHYVNIASRLARLAISNEDRVGYIAYAGSVLAAAPMAGGVKAMARLHKLLSEARADGDESNPIPAALETKRLLRHRGLVVILTSIGQTDADSQLIKAVRMLSGKHHVVVAAMEDQEISALRTRQSAHWTGPYANLAALEYQRGREIGKQRLRQLGVTVVTASPDRLDQAVLNAYLALRLRAVV